MMRALSRVALQLWIVLFIVFFGAEVIHLEPSLRVVTQLLYGVPLVLWALVRLQGMQDRLDWAALSLLVIFGIVCGLSRDRTESLGALGLATAYVAWFLLMRRAALSELRGPIVLAVATGLAMSLTFNAYLLIQEKLASYAVFGDARFEGVVTFPWESVNALPVLVLVAIPFLAWLEHGWVRTVLSVSVALSAVVVVPISLGRAGWLGLAVAGLVGLLLWPTTVQTLKRMPRWRLAMLGGGAALAGGFGLLLIGPRVVNAIGESGRLLLWEQGLNLIGRSPLVGSGPGVFSWVRLEMPPPEASQLAVRLIHNAFLQTLVDGGLLLGLGAGVALVIGGMTIVGSRGNWSSSDRSAVACLMGFLAALTLDDFSYLPAIVAIVLAAAAFLTPASGHAPRGMRPITLGVLVAAALVAVPNVVSVDNARAVAQSGRAAMVDGRYADAVEGFDAATRSHPENGGYWLGLGMSTAFAGNLNRSVEAYERAARVTPGDPRAYAALASLDPEADAAELLRDAANRTLGDPEYAVRLGIVLASEGRIDEATHAWGRAVALRPELLRALPYDGRGIVLEDVASAARLEIRADRRPAAAADSVALWEIALALDELPNDAGAAWRAVDAARQGDLATATELADAAVAEAPWSAQGYQAQAAVAAFACDSRAQNAALGRERLTPNAYGTAPREPQVRREFVYREASLGPSQPPGARVDLRIDMWPWSLVDQPERCDG